MTKSEAAEVLETMLDNLDPRFAVWGSERRKAEALNLAIKTLRDIKGH